MKKQDYTGAQAPGNDALKAPPAEAGGVDEVEGVIWCGGGGSGRGGLAPRYRMSD